MRSLIFVFALLMLLPFVSSEEETTFLLAEKDLPYNVTISCNLNDYFCFPTTVCNITINYANGAYLINNQRMFLQGANAYYNLTGEQTSTVGDYAVDIKCNDPLTGLNASRQAVLSITPTGESITTAQSFLYSVVLFIAIILFAGFVTLGMLLPGENKRDAITGYIIAVSNIKYLKLISWFAAYLAFVVILYFSWMISYAYLTFDFVPTLFQFLFYTFAWLTVPILVIGAYIVIANLVRDSKVGEMISRGLKVA